MSLLLSSLLRPSSSPTSAYMRLLLARICERIIFSKLAGRRRRVDTSSGRRIRARRHLCRRGGGGVTVREPARGIRRPKCAAGGEPLARAAFSSSAMRALSRRVSSASLSA